jgi:hypothetical protein
VLHVAMEGMGNLAEISSVVLLISVLGRQLRPSSRWLIIFLSPGPTNASLTILQPRANVQQRR